ncbi:MAG: transcriptional regulator [Verrucomicrobia bacterium]|nr:MAG: transcriptional regulator [Verrucomicrobiota bacterium]
MILAANVPAYFMKKRALKRPSSRTRAAAATRDVLGTTQPDERIPSKWRKNYRRLIELRNQFLERRGELAKDARDQQPTFSSHMADAGTDNYDRDFALSMLSSEQDAVYEIDAALNRIREGTYGTCELTGKRIESKRLDAIPWTRFSAAAENQIEKEGAISRAKLSPRQIVAGEPPTEGEEEQEEENP